MVVQTVKPLKISKVRPLGDRVLLDPDKPEEMSSGGVVFSARARQRKHCGTVLAVGPKVTEIQPGARVKYFPGISDVIRAEGRELFMLGQNAISALLIEA